MLLGDGAIDVVVASSKAANLAIEYKEVIGNLDVASKEDQARWSPPIAGFYKGNFDETQEGDCLVSFPNSRRKS